MRLRFIGSNGSMGLHFGQTYRLAVEPWQEGVRITSPIVCPYESEEAFWKNWVQPDVELRTVMEEKGRALREEHIPSILPAQECSRAILHGSHNWESETTTGEILWCPGKTI